MVSSALSPRLGGCSTATLSEAQLWEPPPLPDREVPLHLHRALVFSLVLSGQFHFRDVFTQRSEVLRAGEVMLAEPGSVLSGRQSGRFRTLMIPLDPWSLQGGSSRGTFKLQDRATLELVHAALQPGGDARDLAARLLRRWRLRNSPLSCPEGDLQPDQLSRLEEARQWLEADPGSRRDLQTAARFVGWHPHHFQRLFRRRYGLSPAQYQRQLRIEQARDRLKQGEAPAAVAVELGFTDQSHLIRTYRQYYGVTPGFIARTSYS